MQRVDGKYSKLQVSLGILLCVVPLNAGGRCTQQGEAAGDSPILWLHLLVLPAPPHLNSWNQVCLYGKIYSYLLTSTVLDQPPWHL